MNVLLLVLGCLPFAAGDLMHRLMLKSPDTVPPYLLISFLSLVVWGLIAFLARSRAASTKQVVVCLNFVAGIVLVLDFIQEVILHAYWPNVVGIQTQFFYLPLIRLGFRLTDWSSSVFPAYCAAFALMAAASLLGCKLKNGLSQ